MAEQAAGGRPPLRIVSYNIQRGGGRRVAFIGSVLAALEPDVVLLQEALDTAAVHRIAQSAGLAHVVQRPRWSVAALAREAVDAAWHRPPRARGWLELRPSRAPGLRLV